MCVSLSVVCIVLGIHTHIGTTGLSIYLCVCVKCTKKKNIIKKYTKSSSKYKRIIYPLQFVQGDKKKCNSVPAAAIILYTFTHSPFKMHM